MRALVPLVAQSRIQTCDDGVCPSHAGVKILSSRRREPQQNSGTFGLFMDCNRRCRLRTEAVYGGLTEEAER
jgi:hypothetical protein